jgi:hypothetical protein
MTPKQRNLALHALGLPNRENVAYRNHYCAAPGSPEYGEWEEMVRLGMATRMLGGSERSGDFFYLTSAGKEAALGGGP